MKLKVKMNKKSTDRNKIQSMLFIYLDALN